MPIYHHQAQLATGEPRELSSFKGQVLLIVNTASGCGFTPQYEGLEALYQRYKDQGFSVLAFPCNQFGKQEPGTEAEILEFCQLNYQVSFPLFAKIDVNGPNAHPLYQELKRSQRGIFGSENIKWNFTKFLVNREGEVVARFASMTAPEKLSEQIEALL